MAIALSSRSPTPIRTGEMKQRFFISIGLVIAVCLVVWLAFRAKERPSPEAALNRVSNFLRAGDQLAAEKMILPSREYGNKLESDEMRRWAAGELDFVILGQQQRGDLAIFPIVWTGNNAADAT